ncbi:MAG: glycosyltransferase family 39 protein [Chloroflexi bacterium]|nr:glycosyltransferase family 39 protein [Chloroflexota bacterium]
MQDKKRRFSISTAVFSFALLVSAVGAGSGQYLLSEDIVREYFHSKPLVPVGPALWSVLPGISLLAVSGVLFALASRRCLRKKAVSPSSRPASQRSDGGVMAADEGGGAASPAWLAGEIVFALAGLATAGYMARYLLAGKYSPELPYYALGCLLAFFLALLCHDVRRGLIGSRKRGASPSPLSARERVEEVSAGASSPERKSVEEPPALVLSPVGGTVAEKIASPPVGPPPVSEPGEVVHPVGISGKWFPLRPKHEDEAVALNVEADGGQFQLLLRRDDAANAPRTTEDEPVPSAPHQRQMGSVTLTGRMTDGPLGTPSEPAAVTPPADVVGSGDPLPPGCPLDSGRTRARAPGRHGFNVTAAIKTALRPKILAEGVFVVLLIALFIYLNVRDLTSTAYAALGDEYSFFSVARSIALGGPANLFSQKGVFGYHPVVDSAYQALVMDYFGINQFGWKLSGVLVVAITLVPLYLFARHMFGSLTAVLAAAFAASSHYLFAYAHTGYNNIHSVLPPVLAACAAAAGISRRSSALIFLAGVFAGLGFYTFFSARFAIAALLLAVLFSGWRLATIKLLFFAAAGFAVVTFPIFAVDKLDVINAMLSNSVARGSGDWLAVADVASKRALQGLLGFNYNPAAVHYVSGSLLEPVSAALAAVGMVTALVRLADWRFRFLLIWLIVGLVVAGGFYQGFNIAMSRLMILVPFVAVLAAVVAGEFVRCLFWPAGRRFLRVALPSVAVGLLLAVVLAANLQRFWSIAPARLPLRPETLAVETVLAAEIDRATYASPVVIAPAPDALARLVFDSYEMGARNPVFLSGDEKAAAERYADSPVIVFIETGDADEKAIFSRLKARAPEATFAEKWDRAHKQRVGMITNPRPLASASLLPAGTASGLRAVMRLGGQGKDGGQFNAPRDVATDRQSNIFVADTGNHRVQKFDAGGNLVLVFGAAAGSEGYLSAPGSVAVDGAGGIAVIDGVDRSIKRFSAGGDYLGKVGRDLSLARPRALAFDPQGNLYVADADHVLKLASDGQVVATMTGGTAGTQFRDPTGLVVDASGRLYVVDGVTGAVSKWDPQGRLELRWDTPARGGEAQPKIGIGPDGTLVVSAPNSRAVLRFNSNGQPQGNFSGKSLVGQRLEVLAGLAVDGRGNVYLADAVRHEVSRLAFY